MRPHPSSRGSLALRARYERRIPGKSPDKHGLDVRSSLAAELQHPVAEAAQERAIVRNEEHRAVEVFEALRSTSLWSRRRGDWSAHPAPGNSAD